MACGCQMIGEETSQHRHTSESDMHCESFSHLQGQYTSSRTYTTLPDAIFEGSAGDLQLHQELASGGRRPEREAIGAAGLVRHEQRAGGDHPQPADVNQARAGAEQMAVVAALPPLAALLAVAGQ